MSMAERKIMTRAVKNPVKRKLTRAEKKEIAAVIQAAKGDGKPHTAQQTIPYLQMYPDGICRVTEKKYSKSLVFEDIMILSRLVDTFISRISLTMLPVPNPHNTVCVLLWEEARHWQSRSSGYSSS